jgi:hypothetical protein
LVARRGRRSRRGGVHEGRPYPYQPAEKAALVVHAVRCFCLTGGNLSGDDMAACFLDNLDAITAACVEPGPFVFAVQRRRIERLVLG